jgi:hypothetical protein
MVALKPGLQVLQYVGSVTQLMQFGSVQANATVAMSITNNNLIIVIIITKINP